MIKGPESGASSTPGSRLPDLRKLSADVRSAKQGKASVGDSVDYVVDHALETCKWEGIEDLAEAAFDETAPDKGAKAVAYHLQVIRGELARQLWRRHIFVGVSVLDELLLRATAAGSQDPVLATLEHLRDDRLDMQSLMVFPLHSFGILAGGLLRPLRGASAVLLNPSRRLALTPQTNDLHRTVSFINDVGPKLGVKKPIDFGLIQHWRQSRGARWLEDNPLLIAGMASVTGYYYENEFLLLGRVRALTVAITMLADLQPRPKDRAATFFSSSRVNNWETRDIRHYLLLSDSHGKHLTGQAVPIHRRRHVDEISDLAVEIDPRVWRRRKAEADELYSAVESLYDGYLRHSVGASKETAIGRTYRKMFEAVTYFRRSHQGEDPDWSAVVTLATAFEMLLTDHYEGGVSERLRRRTENLLRGVRGTRRYQKAVVDVYNARSVTVHRGQMASMDLYDGRQAFVLAFLSLMRRVSTLKPTEPLPMAFLTGDM